MKIKLTRILLAALVTFAPLFSFFAPPAEAQAQATLIQTTLASSVSGPAGYSGTSPTISQTIFLASTTGIAAPLLPGTPVSIIYIDREAMGVFQVNTSLNAVSVIRGYMGTQASPHISGQMVLVSNLYSTTNAVGANIVPSGFFQNDPPQGGTCLTVPTVPWVNVLTGAQWICALGTGTAGGANLGTWVPGWNNPLAQGTSPSPTATVAAATGTITPSGPYFQISGAGAISGFNVATGAMTGFNSSVGGYGCFLVTSAAGATWTWTAAGNIMTAGTGTAGHNFTFCWNPSLAKFVPSALS